MIKSIQILFVHRIKMGNTQSSNTKVNFEDIQYVLKIDDHCLLINTLNEREQDCLIPKTINASQEETMINKLLQDNMKNIKIIVYGRNCNDENIYKKQSQLLSLGFYEVYVYVGGLFEWLMLQDIYGHVEFPTTKKEKDFLKFKPSKAFGVPLLQYTPNYK